MTMEDGRGARKSDNITATPTRTALTTSKNQQSEREQEPPKKPRSVLKKDLTEYFGQGKRSPVPTTAGNPIETVIQRREMQAVLGTPTGKEDSGTGEGGKKDDNNSWLTPLVKRNKGKKNKTPKGARDEEGHNTKKPRSDDEDSAEEHSKGTDQAGATVDLESMSAPMRKKSPKTTTSKPTNSKGKKATFAPEESEDSAKKKEEEEVAVNFQCVIEFAIRVDRGNNTKGGFDKKLSEGLSFLREFVDPATCILSNGKDNRLGPIKSKADLPKYQITMRNYFNIPNPMAFSNVTQDNGRVIKGSAIMGFSTDPKNCLEDAAGDLRTMGCSLFYKKCQEVETVSKLILLRVPDSIEEDVIKDTLDNVLSTIEGTLLQTDSDYKLPHDQQSRWINFAVTKEFPPGMPWEDAEETKKKQGGNNARLAYVLQVHQPDYDRISKLCHIVKQRKLWAKHWGNTAFTVEIPDNDSQQSKKVCYIQMVQTHGSVQLSLGAASINGVIDADSTFSLHLTPEADGSPRAATQTSLREVFRMMEVKS